MGRKIVMFAVLTVTSLLLLKLAVIPSSKASLIVDDKLSPASRDIAVVRRAMTGANANEKNAVPNSNKTTLEKVTRVVDIQLKNGKFVGEGANIQLQHNDVVKFIICSDQEDILHLHGYDVSQPLSAEKMNEFTLKVRLAGRFEIELHSNKKVVGQLEVFPR